MPTAIAKGVIIAATVLVAAGIAAYENPQIREWFEKSSQKVAMAFRSLGDDIPTRQRPRPRPRRQDSSMHEDHDEKAEERRRRAREEVLEKARVLQEQRKRRKLSRDSSRTMSFDSMVDEDGRLRAEAMASGTEPPTAISSAVEGQEADGIRSRHEQAQMHQSVDAPMLLRQLTPGIYSGPAAGTVEPWESQYEREMRNAWNIELPPRSNDVPRSHASESLIDLTPTSEEFPDPDYSIPSTEDLRAHLGRIEYFSAAASRTSHTMSEDADNPFDDVWGQPPLMQLTPMEPRPMSPRVEHSNIPSSHPSLASSAAEINRSEAEMTDDDLSDFGDGIRTPASAWTEVASSISGDD